METRSQSKVSGSQTRPRATSEGRTQSGTADSFNSVVSLVNPPSSPTGPARGGKLPLRIPPKGGPPRASSPYPRSESAGGAGGSPDGSPSRRRGQIRESGDAGGRQSMHGLPPEIAAVDSGKTLRLPDEGAREFTLVLTRHDSTRSTLSSLSSESRRAVPTWLTTNKL